MSVIIEMPRREKINQAAWDELFNLLLAQEDERIAARRKEAEREAYIPEQTHVCSKHGEVSKDFCRIVGCSASAEYEPDYRDEEGSDVNPALERYRCQLPR